MFRNSIKKLLFLATAVVAITSLVFTACSDNQSENASDSSALSEKPLIVVTTNILGDVVSNMVGESFDVEIIMPPGADPHDFQASAQQVAKIMEADLLVVNGANFEEGMLDVIEAAESDGVMVFEAISVIAQLEGSDDHDDHEGHDDHDDHEGHDDHDDHEGHDDHDHGGIDPHFFTDPARMMQMAEELSEFLVANFPNADQNFVSIANNYTKQLRDLDTEVEEVLSAIPADRRVMVTNHSVFAYFAERYEFEILGEIIPTTSTLANASAQQLAALAEELKSSQVSAIFADASSSNILAQTIASEVDGVEVVNLFTESLGDPDAAGASYIEMVRFNAQTIASALLD